MALSIQAAAYRRKPTIPAVEPKPQPEVTSLDDSSPVDASPSSEGFDESVDISAAGPLG